MAKPAHRILSCLIILGQLNGLEMSLTQSLTPPNNPIKPHVQYDFDMFRLNMTAFQNAVDNQNQLYINICTVAGYVYAKNLVTYLHSLPDFDEPVPDDIKYIMTMIENQITSLSIRRTGDQNQKLNNTHMNRLSSYLTSHIDILGVTLRS
jgi:hypothetical protein